MYVHQTFSPSFSPIEPSTGVSVPFLVISGHLAGPRRSGVAFERDDLRAYRDGARAVSARKSRKEKLMAVWQETSGCGPQAGPGSADGPHAEFTYIIVV